MNVLVIGLEGNAFRYQNRNGMVCQFYPFTQQEFDWCVHEALAHFPAELVENPDRRHALVLYALSLEE